MASCESASGVLPAWRRRLIGAKAVEQALQGQQLNDQAIRRGQPCTPLTELDANSDLYASEDSASSGSGHTNERRKLHARSQAKWVIVAKQRAHCPVVT